MERPEFLHKYIFDWDMLDVIISRKSALDTKSFLGPLNTREQVSSFIQGYGLDYNDPVSRAELFGNFQEALQFIKRYFLNSKLPHAESLKVPNSIYMITDISDLFYMATRSSNRDQIEERLWAEIILKVMHTLLHVDKDLRSGYFKEIQTQVFDEFYRYVYRDENDALYLGFRGEGEAIPLLDFETKSKKSRDSVIIKLLHKVENVAEELFDRVGIRFVTQDRFDTLRVIKFLMEQNIVVPHNIKPSRSVNTLIDIQEFKRRHMATLKKCMREKLSEQEFLNELNKAVEDCLPNISGKRNVHSSNEYRSIQFTGRKLIKYRNPFFKDFKEVRNEAKKVEEENELAKKILALDMSQISRDIKFFYPYEVQVIDEHTHKVNTEGEASHAEYKKAQTKSAYFRLFTKLLRHYGLDPENQ